MSSHANGISTRFVFAEQRWDKNQNNSDSWKTVEVTDYEEGIVEIQTEEDAYIAFRVSDLLRAIKVFAAEPRP